MKPRFNIAPTQTAPVVRRAENGGRELAMLRWGLVPSWAQDAKIGYRTINARAETVATAPTFRAAFKRRRCLVPADGFYEWKATGGGKQPYHIGMADGAPFAFAGLWERWDKGEASLESYTIITCEPNALCAQIHNRMPVIVAPENHDAGLCRLEARRQLAKRRSGTDRTGADRALIPAARMAAACAAGAVAVSSSLPAPAPRPFTPLTSRQNQFATQGDHARAVHLLL